MTMTGERVLFPAATRKRKEYHENEQSRMGSPAVCNVMGHDRERDCLHPFPAFDKGSAAILSTSLHASRRESRGSRPKANPLLERSLGVGWLTSSGHSS